MSNPLTSQHLTSIAPLDYTTPPFPSLYWPFPIDGPQSYYLYHTVDVVRFTVFWTLVFFGAMHLVTAGFAVAMQLLATAASDRRSRQNTDKGRSKRRKGFGLLWFAIGIPSLYLIIGGVEAVIAGSVVGGLLGGIYNAGYFQMSTWIPFVWSLINALLLILSSFAIQGGL